MVSIRNARGLLVIAALSTASAAHAQSGLLTRPIDVGPLTLASGQPLAAGPIELESGKQYSLTIKADGTAELAIQGSEFFRNVWINEVIINDIEVRPLGLDSIEFDAASNISWPLTVTSCAFRSFCSTKVE